MKKSILLFLGCSALLQQHSYAGGFKTGMQGIKQLGMGHTGVGFAQDAATIYFNPAGMSFVNSQVTGGIHALIPTVSFLESGTNSVTNATTQVFTPLSLYGNFKLSKRIHFGIGAYTPFGSGVMYPTGWVGSKVLTSIKLQTVFVQPTLSYKIAKNFSIGAGIIFANGNVNLQKDLPINSSSPYSPAHATLDGDAKGTGYNVGIYFKNEKNLSVGLAYHSKVTMSVSEGNAFFDNVPLALSSSFPAANSFQADLKLPSELALGASMKLNSRVTVAADFNYTYWNSYDSLGFDYRVNSASLTDAKSARLYENAMALRAGVQVDAARNIQLRAGAYFDQTPVQNGYVSPESPDNDRIGLTCGASFKLEDRLHLDLSLLYSDVFERTQTNIETGLSGTFKTKVIAPGVGLSWQLRKKSNQTKNY